MVLAVSNPLRAVNGERLKRRAAPIALMAAAADASLRGKVRADDPLAAKSATLMIAAKAGVYITTGIPIGQFTIVDPETLSASDRVVCPFKVKTLVVHPEDLDQAIAHFKAPAGKN